MYGTQKGDQDSLNSLKTLMSNMVSRVLKHHLSLHTSTYNIVDRLKAEGDWEVLQNLVSDLMIIPKGVAHCRI
jgi:aconitase B